jgi:carbamoyltransferase
MQKKMNLKIKYRESFRPFAPSVMLEMVNEYFDLDRESPYMLLVDYVKKQRQNPMTKEQERLFGIDKLNVLRSDIPAVTHIDYSARIQTVDRSTALRYWNLINAFKELSGYGIVVNTSFNVRGEPIVCTPEDSYLCFMRTEMDYLFCGNWMMSKTQQPKLRDDVDWRRQYELD